MRSDILDVGIPIKFWVEFRAWDYIRYVISVLLTYMHPRLPNYHAIDIYLLGYPINIMNLYSHFLL